MKNLILFFFTSIVLFSCNQQSKNNTENKNVNSNYIISKEGIGELKIGMSQAYLEKLLNQQFQFNNEKDSERYWQDTVKTKYKEIEVSLIFQRQYNDDDNSAMQLVGVETSSPLCKTATGIGIGNNKSEIISSYDDNPIVMGPEWEQVNDTTWAPSKTKFNIQVRDDKYDHELIFHLLNKKVVSLETSMIMGD